MGNVYAEITLKNVGDLILVEKGHLNEKSAREVVVNAVVDTGAHTLVIGENIREKLGLEVRGEDWVRLADGSRADVKKVAPVEVHWKNRMMTCQPVLLPGTNEVLLGAIPLEDMDLIVDPKREELTGRHGDKPLHRL